MAANSGVPPASQAAISWGPLVITADSPTIGRLLARRAYFISTADKWGTDLEGAYIGLIAE